MVHCRRVPLGETRFLLEYNPGLKILSLLAKIGLNHMNYCMNLELTLNCHIGLIIYSAHAGARLPILEAASIAV